MDSLGWELFVVVHFSIIGLLKQSFVYGSHQPINNNRLSVLKNRVKELENLVQEEKSKNGENKNKVNFLFPGNINLVLSCIDRVAMNCGTS